MTRSEAATLISNLVQVEIEATKRMNTRQGGMTKTVQRKEREAIGVLFHALTGDKPTEGDIENILS